MLEEAVVYGEPWWEKYYTDPCVLKEGHCMCNGELCLLIMDPRRAGNGTSRVEQEQESTGKLQELAAHTPTSPSVLVLIGLPLLTCGHLGARCRTTSKNLHLVCGWFGSVRGQALNSLVLYCSHVQAWP